MFRTLQVGRGIAATAVAAFHLALLLNSPDFGGSAANPFLDVFGRGYLGVDFFFVLSGFIIFHAHENDLGRPERLVTYVEKRFVRIYPIYWVYLVACIVGMLAVKSSHFQLASLTDWLTAFGLLRLSAVELPLAQAWTLFHEVLFYGVFLLLIAHRLLGVAAFGVWMIAVAVLFYYPSSDGQAFRDVLLGAYNLNFLIGMCAFKIVKHASPRLAKLLFVLGLAAVTTSYMCFAADSSPTAQLLVGIAFGILLAGAAALEKQARLTLPAWLGFIGDASYSIYLLHEHVETYSIRALRIIGINGTDYPYTTFAVALTTTLVTGCLAYWFVEKPLLNKLRPGARRGSHATPSPARD